MRRSLVWVVVVVALIVLLAVVTLAPARVRSATPLAWARLPETGLRTFPGSTGPVFIPPADIAHPTVVPSATATPTSELVPPFVGAKGAAGIATWYAYHPGQAAAARALRELLGPNWRGMVVHVCGPVGCQYVTLTDYESSKIPGRLIDLDARSFEVICGPLSKGVCYVQVTHQ